MTISAVYSNEVPHTAFREIAFPAPSVRFSSGGEETKNTRMLLVGFIHCPVKLTVVVEGRWLYCYTNVTANKGSGGWGGYSTRRHYGKCEVNKRIVLSFTIDLCQDINLCIIHRTWNASVGRRDGWFLRIPKFEIFSDKRIFAFFIFRLGECDFVCNDLRYYATSASYLHSADLAIPFDESFFILSYFHT